jgi:hypothetical protein
MALRFNYKVLVLLAIVLGAGLLLLCLTQGRFSRTSLVRGSEEPTGENGAMPDGRGEAIAAAARPQALLPSARPVLSDRQSDDEDESPGQSSAKTTAHKGAQGGKETEGSPRATKPITKPQLVVSNPMVKETGRGPVATFQFSRTTTDPIGPVIIVAFLSPGSEAKILDLSPAGSTNYSEIDKRISENGWFAAFRGTPQDQTDLSFRLSVSQPATAMIKGNCGIQPFKIDLRPGRY